MVKFNFPNEPVLDSKGGNSIHKDRIILCLKVCRMILKGCLYHIVNVKDLDSKTTPIDLVHIVREFQRSFLLIFEVFIPNGKIV